VLNYAAGGVATAADARAPQQSGPQQTAATGELPPLQTLDLEDVHQEALGF